MAVTDFDLVATSIDKMTTIKAHSGSEAVALADFNKNHTNTGAGGTVVLTLPAVSTVTPGYLRVHLTAAQAVRMTPASGEKVYLGGDGVASKYLNIAGVIGNYCTVYCDGTAYYVTNYSGVLTKEA